MQEAQSNIAGRDYLILTSKIIPVTFQIITTIQCH